MIDPALRMLKLLSLLQTRKSWPGAELAGRLEVSARTLRRDIERLREFGYIVSATRGTDGGYQLEPGADLPPLLLDDDEAVAIAVGLRTAANGAVTGIEETSVRVLAKLEQVLPARLRRQVNTLSTYTVSMSMPGPTVDADALTAIAQCCRDWERLCFDYRSRDEVNTTRNVEPNRLVCLGRRWYLVAWDVERHDWRTFRVDRMCDIRSSGARFAARELPATDAAEFVRNSMRSAPRRFDVVATVHATQDDIRARFAMRDAVVEPVDARSCRLTMSGDSLEWLAMSLGVLNFHFEVHQPPELIAYMAVLAERFANSTKSTSM